MSLFKRLFSKGNDGIFVSSQDKTLRVNCLHLVPGNSRCKKPHCFLGNGNEGECFVYTGATEFCEWRSPKFVPLSKEDIEAKLTKIEQSAEWQKRCLEANICPECGHGLQLVQDDEVERDDGGHCVPVKKLTVKLTYFKDTGKYYTHGEYETEYKPLGKIWDEVRDMADEQRLPGLNAGHSDFIISVDVPGHKHEHPRLIIPERIFD